MPAAPVHGGNKGIDAMKKTVTTWYRLSLAAVRSVREFNLGPLRQARLLARLGVELTPVGVETE